MLSYLQHPETRTLARYPSLSWLNAIAEDDLGDESESENVCQGLDQGSANSEQVRPT